MSRPCKSLMAIIFALQMEVKDEIGDAVFDAGMLAGAKELGDPGTQLPTGAFNPDWVPAFKHDIHGLILITGDCHKTVDEKLAQIEEIFYVGAHHALIHEVYRTVGNVRPGKEKGHEQFVSNCALIGIYRPLMADLASASLMVFRTQQSRPSTLNLSLVRRECLKV